VTFWMWFVFWLGLIVVIGQFLDWIGRRRWRENRQTQALIPSVWSDEVYTYYRHTPTRRQLS
jgi:hypothetical protein